MRAGGATVAVFASALAKPTPPSNRGLFRRIARDGCIISELPPMIAAKGYSFTARNRVIAALSSAVIVVQATADSGSLVTARWGLKLGRPVFVLIGDSIFDNSKGVNTLLLEGAVPLIGPEVLRDHLGLRIQDWPRATRRPVHGKPAMANADTTASVPDLTGAELEVYNLLTGGPISVDEMVQATNLSAPQVLSVLSSLELKGRVQRLGGGRFSAIDIPDLFS